MNGCTINQPGWCPGPIPQSIQAYDALVASIITQLTRLDSVPVTTRAMMTYTVGDQTYGWNEYRASLMSYLSGYEAGRKALVAASWAGHTVHSVVR